MKVLRELLREVKVSLLAMVALLIILCGVYPAGGLGHCPDGFSAPGQRFFGDPAGSDCRAATSSPKILPARGIFIRGRRRRATPAMTAPTPAAAIWGRCPRN